MQHALSELYGPFGGPRLGAWQDDPFALFSGWVQQRAQETPVRPRDGKLFVEAGGRSYVVLLMRLRQPAFAMSTQEAVMPLMPRPSGPRCKRRRQRSDCGRRGPACGRGQRASRGRDVDHRRRFAARHYFADVADLPVAETDRPDPAVDRHRLPRRAVGLLAAVRPRPSADAGVRRQPDRRRAGLRHLFSVHRLREIAGPALALHVAARCTALLPGSGLA